MITCLSLYLLQHIPVRPEDHHLQVIAIGGRYFQEKTLTFGCSSSPSLYDAPAEVVLALACISSRTPRHYCLRQLDDAMIIADLPQVKAWYRAYEDVCAYIEVRLAGVENPAKACAPASCGQLLGINVNLDNWTWNLDQNKANKILVLLFLILQNEKISTKDMSKLCGKLTHYAPIFGAKWERGFLIHSFSPRDQDTKMIKATLNIKSQAAWWVRCLGAGQKFTPIPLPWTPVSADPVMLYADAAGPGHGGAGAIAFENVVTAAFIPWPEFVDKGVAAPSGAKLGTNLTTLEAIAGILAVSMDPDRIRNKSVCLITDNIAFSYAWKSGHSRDPLTYTVCKAMETVARALNSRLEVRHQKRCSDVPTTAADLMSRGRTRDIFEATGHPSHCRLGWVSRVLCKWLSDPKPTRILGTKMVQEMAMFTPVLSLEVEWEDELYAL
mgnify:CR=1 FL=1